MATPTRRLAALLAGITDNDQATKVTTAGINDDAVTNAQIGTDAVNADSIAANAVGTSEVADNVLSATDLAANSVGESELSVDYTAQSVPHIIPGVLYPAYDDKKLDGTALAASTTGPASSTVASSKYGTVQSDGRMYYYTFIKGSKPIKDPRIGAYFGSQRHQLDSLQLLEQETAAHGSNVYSVDGREWIRTVGGVTTTNDLNGLRILLNSTTDFVEIVGYFSDLNYGVYTDGPNRTIRYTLDDALEKATNYGASTAGTPLGSRYIDTSSSINLGLGATLGIHTIKLKRTGNSINNLYNIELIAHEKFTDATCDYNNDPTITHDANTRIVAGLTVTGTGIPANATVASVTSSTEFELSAATTGGAVTNGTLTFGTNNIQIPSQNVVSYGKKFSISSASPNSAALVTPHYDPFSAKTDGSAWTSPTSGTNNANSAASWPTNIDTANSLGLDKWVDGSSYYRPYNGGRVVKYVDSTGTIKTAVTVMPPNAKSIKSADVNKKAKNAGNTTYLPTFEDETTDVNEDLLHEVAKTFHWREFGNGAANQGAGGTRADASMLDAADDIVYVMDDGLTSLSGDDVDTNDAGDRMFTDENKAYYITFIGTGFTFKVDSGGGGAGTHHVAQNLPYGTHVIKQYRDSSNADPHITVDGIQFSSVNIDSYTNISEITFHQPKRPPIPEDACVIADYMLMADFVAQTDGDLPHISKGVRFCSSSRDGFYDGNGTAFYMSPQKLMGGYQIASNQNGHTLSEARITAFGHAFGMSFQRDSDRVNNAQVRLDGANFSYAEANIWDTDTVWDDSNDDGTIDKSGAATQELYGIKNQTLGVHTFGDKTAYNPGGSNNYNDWASWQIATPIHTSSHYQTFETPFLYELVGGDRNMEQHNLVVSPDGKTWDEVTRDTSYIGNQLLNAFRSAPAGSPIGSSSTATWILDEWRGSVDSGNEALFNKDWAIAYDRIICLVDGSYTLDFGNHYETGAHIILKINGTNVKTLHHPEGGGYGAVYISWTNPFKRGDYVQIAGGHSSDSTTQNQYNHIQILRDTK